MNRDNWSIEKGDYLRGDDGFSKKHQKALKRVQIIKRILLVAGFSAGFVIFLLLLHFFSSLF